EANLSRAYLTTPAPRFEIRESSAAGAARQLGPTEFDLRRYRVEQAAGSGVSGAETRVHTPAPGESEAQNRLPDLILSSEPKPLVQHRPPPPQFVWSPGGGMCRGGGSGGDCNAAVTASLSASVEANLSA
nr:hypothetical protein [Tanacetum cinerariifolium]GFB68731.1 hypothetical protein [Tanacetum cinerariifolium]